MSKLNTIQTILSKCEGVETKRVESKNFRSETIYNYVFLKVGEVVFPTDIYIEIIGTATKGTIARVVSFEIETYDERFTHSHKNAPNKIVDYNNTIIWEVDGRKQKGRINSSHVKLLNGEQVTKYVRDVQTHDKVEIKNPVNKYKQELKKGDWVIGVKPGKGLGIGRITRWTNHTVWAVKPGNELTDKSAEFKFDSIDQTFTIPPDDIEQSLTMAILKGYTGN